jgi:hypothetical protein
MDSWSRTALDYTVCTSLLRFNLPQFQQYFYYDVIGFFTFCLQLFAKQSYAQV